MNTFLSISTLEKLKYPEENSRYFLALVISFLLFICFFLLLFFIEPNRSFILLFVLFLLWLSRQFSRAYIMANAIEVSHHNFPEILREIEHVRSITNYQGDCQMFIVEESSLCAFLGNFFTSNFLIIHSNVIEELLSSHDTCPLRWIIAQFLGSQRSRQLRFEMFQTILQQLINFRLFNLFIYPYERAVHFTGDNISMVICGNIEGGFKAFEYLLFGKHITNRISLNGVLEQKQNNRKNYYINLTRYFSSRPHIIDRYMNLLAFAKKYYPRQYFIYLHQQNPNSIEQIDRLIPDTYMNNPILQLQRFASYSRNNPQVLISRKEIRERIKIGNQTNHSPESQK